MKKDFQMTEHLTDANFETRFRNIKKVDNRNIIKNNRDIIKNKI